MKFCKQCNKNVETYWELESCDKNPEGVIPEPCQHGNIVGNTPTCEDDYCRPQYTVIDDPTPEYIFNHEAHERCSECDQFMECM